ncbi:MAG: kelch repeat-containing protein [Planctomycetota bacterium]
MKIPRLLVPFVFGCSAVAQEWTRLDGLPDGLGALVYDAAQQRLLGSVAFPQETWSFDGAGWRRHQPDGLGVHFGAQPMTFLVGYDAAAGRPVLTTSAATGYPNGRTYVGELGGWKPVVSSTPDRQAGGLASDPATGRLLVFGGTDSTFTETDSLFAWTGTAWTAVSQALRPSPRLSPAMALDPTRGRVVLFGGRSGSNVLGDTWEWDGASWTQRAPAMAPSARAAAMAFDPARQRVVVLGGLDAGYAQRPDTWEWDGATWTPSGNLPQAMAPLACNDGAAVVIGTSKGELWRRSGTGWNVLFADPRPVASGGAVAWDPTRGELLLAEAFGSGRTMAWNGSWQVRSTGGPSPRIDAALAPLGTDMVLFGGLDVSYLPLYAMYDQTWRWNGQSWTQAMPAHAPSPRYGHAMVATGGTILLFGGVATTGLAGDTWRYDGVDWTELQPIASPSPRTRPALAYDATRQRAVLFGGLVQSTPMADTWEWDGQNWIVFSPTNQPFGGSWPMAAAPTGVTLLDNFDVWTWNGIDWSAAPPTGALPHDGRMVWDPARQRLLHCDIVGGMYAYGPTAPSVAATGSICGNATGLRLFGQPGIGRVPSVHCEGAPNSVVFTIYGLQLQTTSWATNCFQYVSADAVRVGATDALGHLDLPFAIPAALGLRGVQIHSQAVVLDGGPVFGGSITGALHLTIGD